MRLPAASEERRGHRPAALAAVLALFVAGCGSGEPDRSPPEPQAAQERPAAKGDARPAKDTSAARPTALEIPKLGVRAPVIRLGLNDDRTLEVPKDYSETGWWSGGYAPGERGPAAIAGHVDSEDGPAVFYELDELEPGDEIRIRRADRSAVTFTVQRTESHAKDDFPTRAATAAPPAPPCASSPAPGTSTSPPGTTSTTRSCSRKAASRCEPIAAQQRNNPHERPASHSQPRPGRPRVSVLQPAARATGGL